MIDISGMDKADVLAALYNSAKPQGRGLLHATGGDLETSEARELLSRTTSFDYVRGRVLKVDLDGDSLDPFLYDRDNGAGAAEKALEALGT